MTWWRPQDLVGTTLDERFEILRLLGQGGMGAVYEARHLRLDHRVAVKVLSPRHADSEQQRKRFLREARASVKIRSEHVIRITDFGETPLVYFVMEYLEGIDLAVLMREQGKLPWGRTRAIALQIVRALKAAHQVGIIHRDVKPSNVFVLDDGGTDFIKMLDFGIAKVVSESSPETHGITKTDEVLGTFSYMAPEQALARPVDARTDVYSLGVMLFEMLTGKVPFVGNNAYQLIDQHVREVPPFPRAIEPSVPPMVEALVLRAMAKRPEDRFQDMDELAAAIEGIPDDVRAVTEVASRTSIYDALGPVTDATDMLASVNPSTARKRMPDALPELAALDSAADGRVEDGGAAAVRRRPERWPWLVVSILFMASGVGVWSWSGTRGTQDGVSGASSSPSIPRGEVKRDEGEPMVVLQGAPEEVQAIAPAPLPGDAEMNDEQAEQVAADAPPPGDVEVNDAPADPSPAQTIVKRPSNRPRQPPSDKTLEAQLHERARSKCKIEGKVELTFQVTADGSVRLANTRPRNPCVRELAEGFRFRPREETARKEIVLLP